MTPEEIVKQYFKEQIDDVETKGIQPAYTYYTDRRGNLARFDLVETILIYNKEIIKRLRDEDSSN